MPLGTRAETNAVRFHEQAIAEHIADHLLRDGGCIEYYGEAGDDEIRLETQFHGDVQALTQIGNVLRFKLPTGAGNGSDLNLYVEVEVKARII